MEDKRSITFRLDASLIRALKIRGAMNDRSANGELSTILKNVLEKEKAPEHGLENRSDASDSE